MTQQAEPTSDVVLTSAAVDDPVAELRVRAETLERQLTDLRSEMQTKLVRAEMKAEAVRAGILDLDGLKLLDLADLKVDDHGDVAGAPALIAQLKRNKPWLFGASSSSAAASPPAALPPHSKNATEMTESEYRAARAALLKRRA